MIDSLKKRNHKAKSRAVSKNTASSSHNNPPSTEKLIASQFQPRPSSSSSSSTASSSSAQQPPFSISKLPSKRHALLTGSRALIKRIGKNPSSKSVQQDDNDTSLPLCYLLKEPVTLEDITIQSAEHMSNHILVCLHRQVINMFKFIYNLRSPNLKPEELQDIVLMCSTKPSPKNFELINTFPRVYFIEGNCRHPDDLLRAGAKTAKQVVVMR